MIRPNDVFVGDAGYLVPRAQAPVDLRLDGNEGPNPPAALVEAVTSASIQAYPSAAAFGARWAAWLGVPAERLVVTAGADEAIDRVCRVFLAPGRVAVLVTPGFEMTRRYARATGATLVDVPWAFGAPFPVAAVCAAGAEAALIVLTTPDNPTGRPIPTSEVLTVVDACPGAAVLVDLAYVEFGDEDPTPAVCTRENAIVARTTSKAWGLAGLRVGAAIAAADVAAMLRAAGPPYPVAGPSLAIADARVALGFPADFADWVRGARVGIASAVRECGGIAEASAANFVFARVPDPLWLRDALAGLGIAVRAFPGAGLAAEGVRIACPEGEASLTRLTRAIRTALRPEAVLFDLDGVLADVSQSYRAAIVATAARFGVQVTPADIQREKDAGDANDDWALTLRLVRAGGVAASEAEVTAVFQALYLGADGVPGLCEREGLLVAPGDLAALAARLPLAIVTGRPRAEAEAFLARTGLRPLFRAVVCREDAALKPDPAPVRAAMAALGVTRAWMVGDTPDDVRAARAAGVVPWGVGEPGPLYAAGAARVAADPLALVAVLP